MCFSRWKCKSNIPPPPKKKEKNPTVTTFFCSRRDIGVCPTIALNINSNLLQFEHGNRKSSMGHIDRAVQCCLEPSVVLQRPSILCTIPSSPFCTDETWLVVQRLLCYNIAVRMITWLLLLVWFELYLKHQLLSSTDQTQLHTHNITINNTYGHQVLLIVRSVRWLLLIQFRLLGCCSMNRKQTNQVGVAKNRQSFISHSAKQARFKCANPYTLMENDFSRRIMTDDIRT